MKKTELMIGNWVYLPDMSTGIDYPARLNENFIYDAKYAEPIPLTPEILEKNGFIEEEDGLFLLKSKDWLVGLDYFEKKQWAVGIANFPNKLDELAINYVHELQNALTLCKIEKQIVL